MNHWYRLGNKTQWQSITIIDKNITTAWWQKWSLSVTRGLLAILHIQYAVWRRKSEWELSTLFGWTSNRWKSYLTLKSWKSREWFFNSNLKLHNGPNKFGYVCTTIICNSVWPKFSFVVTIQDQIHTYDGKHTSKQSYYQLKILLWPTKVHSFVAFLSWCIQWKDKYIRFSFILLLTYLQQLFSWRT